MTKIVDTYQDEVPKIPEHMFLQTKREPDDIPNSYSGYETDHSAYLLDDVPLNQRLTLKKQKIL